MVWPVELHKAEAKGAVSTLALSDHRLPPPPPLVTFHLFSKAYAPALPPPSPPSPRLRRYLTGQWCTRALRRAQPRLWICGRSGFWEGLRTQACGATGAVRKRTTPPYRTSASPPPQPQTAELAYLPAVTTVVTRSLYSMRLSLEGNTKLSWVSSQLQQS